MKNVRIGKDIKIVWPIRINGEDTNLSDYDLTLEITDPFGGKFILPIDIKGSILESEWLGVKQKYLGPYVATLWNNRNKRGQTVVDVCKFVNLVSRSEVEEEPFVSQNVVLPTGVLWIGVKGASAYQTWLNTHEGTEEDFIEWLRQPSSEAASKVEELIEEASTTLSSCKDATKNAEQAKLEADKATQSAITASTLADEKAKRAEQAASSAEQSVTTINDVISNLENYVTMEYIGDL